MQKTSPVSRPTSPAGRLTRPRPGVPLLVQFKNPVRVSSYSLKDSSGTRLASCEIDATNYVKNAAAKSLGRLLLASDNVVFIVPRRPLDAGETYTFEVTSNGEAAHSTFTVTDLDGPRISGRSTPVRCSRAATQPCKVPFTLATAADVSYSIKNSRPDAEW